MGCGESPSTNTTVLLLLLLLPLTNYYCMGTVPFKQVVLFWKRVVEGGVQQGGTSKYALGHMSKKFRANRDEWSRLQVEFTGTQDAASQLLLLKYVVRSTPQADDDQLGRK